MYNQYSLYEECPHETYKYYLSCNKGRVYLSVVNHYGDLIRKGISTNERYIAWLEKHSEMLSVLYTQGIWFMDSESDKDKYLSELMYYIGDSNLLQILDNL